MHTLMHRDIALARDPPSIGRACALALLLIISPSCARCVVLLQMDPKFLRNQKYAKKHNKPASK